MHIIEPSGLQKEGWRAHWSSYKRHLAAAGGEEQDVGRDDQDAKWGLARQKSFCPELIQEETNFTSLKEIKQPAETPK